MKFEFTFVWLEFLHRHKSTRPFVPDILEVEFIDTLNIYIQYTLLQHCH